MDRKNRKRAKISPRDNRRQINASRANGESSSNGGDPVVWRLSSDEICGDEAGREDAPTLSVGMQQAPPTDTVLLR